MNRRGNLFSGATAGGKPGRRGRRDDPQLTNHICDRLGRQPVANRQVSRRPAIHIFSSPPQFVAVVFVRCCCERVRGGRRPRWSWGRVSGRGRYTDGGGLGVHSPSHVRPVRRAAAGRFLCRGAICPVPTSEKIICGTGAEQEYRIITGGHQRHVGDHHRTSWRRGRGVVNFPHGAGRRSWSGLAPTNAWAGRSRRGGGPPREPVEKHLAGGVVDRPSRGSSSNARQNDPRAVGANCSDQVGSIHRGTPDPSAPWNQTATARLLGFLNLSVRGIPAMVGSTDAHSSRRQAE